MTPEEFRIKYPNMTGANFDRAARQLVMHIKKEHRDDLESGSISEPVLFAIETIWANNFAHQLGMPPLKHSLIVPMGDGDPFTLEEISKDATTVTVKLIDKYVRAVRVAKERIYSGKG